MAATVRIGTCSWADEGLLKAWYPRGVSTAEARLRYYAERFDVVEVDSPYYALPDPAVTERWARRTPDAFTFHVKASAAMTWHEGEPTDEAFRLFRAALEPLELLGEAPGRPPAVPPALHEVGGREGRARAGARAPRAARPARRVPPPLLARGGRARRHARVPRGERARVRLARQPPHPGLERLAARRGGDAPGRVRPLPRAERGDLEHPRGAVGRRAVRLALRAGGARGVGRADRPPRRRGGGGLRALQQQPGRLRAAERADPPRAPRRGGRSPPRAVSSLRRPSSGSSDRR